MCASQEPGRRVQGQQVVIEDHEEKGGGGNFIQSQQECLFKANAVNREDRKKGKERVEVEEEEEEQEEGRESVLARESERIFCGASWLSWRMCCLMCWKATADGREKGRRKAGREGGGEGGRGRADGRQRRREGEREGEWAGVTARKAHGERKRMLKIWNRRRYVTKASDDAMRGRGKRVWERGKGGFWGGERERVHVEVSWTMRLCGGVRGNLECQKNMTIA